MKFPKNYLGPDFHGRVFHIGKFIFERPIHYLVQLPYQSKLKLPSQLGENKGSECDAYVRIASQFNAIELSDMSNFVKELFKFYLESKHQGKSR